MDGPANRTVLVVFHEEDVGGASLAVARVMPLLEERGWRFLAWAPDPSPLAEELRARGYEVHGAPRHVRYSWTTLRHPPGARARLASLPGYFRKLRRLVRGRAPALVHVNTILAVPEAVAVRSLGAPTLLHVHEMLPGGFKGAVARRLAHRAAHVVAAVSGANAAPLALPGRRARIVQGGTDVPREVPPPRERDGAPLKLATVGVVSRRKGSDLFVAAAERILAERDDIAFTMVGGIEEGPEAGWARALVERAGRAGIEYLPRVDVKRELAGWDAFVLPSRWDPFPTVVLEAMAHGRPVIGAAVDGIAEQLAGDAGLLVPPDDAAGLAAAMLRLADDPQLRTRVGAAGRRRVEGLFTLDRQAAALEAIYLELAR